MKPSKARQGSLKFQWARSDGNSYLGLDMLRTVYKYELRSMWHGSYGVVLGLGPAEHSTVHPEGGWLLSHPQCPSVPQTVLIGSFLVKTIQFHARGTSGRSRLTVHSDTLVEVVLAASHPVTSSSPTPPHPCRQPRGAKHLTPLYSALASRFRKGTQGRIPGIWVPDTILQELGILGEMGNFFKH